jgi:uncharacterized protein (TIGR02271 family)
MSDVYTGMDVRDASRVVGTVETVERDPTTGAVRVIMRHSDGGRYLLQAGSYTIVGDVLQISTTGFDPHRTQRLPTDVSAQPLGATRTDTTADDIRIPVIEEAVVIGKRVVERGGVRLHKTVDEREEAIEVPTIDETVEVERVPVGQLVDSPPEMREDGDTLIIPVLEEIVVVEKRLMLKEEIRITRRRTEQVESARMVLRKEQVQVESLDDDHERAAGT